MSVALQQPALISEEEYLASVDGACPKHEYLSGVVYAMAGGKNRHHMITGNIFGELRHLLRGRRCQPFNSDTAIRLQHRDDVRVLLSGHERDL